MRDITDYISPFKCKSDGMPLNFEGWITKDFHKSVEPLANLWFLIAAPKSWIISYYFICPRCGRTYEVSKNEFQSTLRDKVWDQCSEEGER